MNWQSRLVVKYTPKGGEEKIISPIDSFSPTFAMNAEAFHSIEQTHVGVVYSPDNITFSLTVKAIGTVAGELTALALKGDEFTIVLQEAETIGPAGGNTEGEWAFEKVVLERCIITNAAPTNATPTGAPTATFSGFSMSGTADTASVGTLPESNDNGQ